MISTVRVQEKGQVTIPRAIRQQLNLKKGDLVTFVSTRNGVIIKTIDLAAEDLLAILEKSLRVKGIEVEKVLARSQQAGTDVLGREFNLSAEERDMLFQALQLKAQAAIENIRCAAQTKSDLELSEEDIETEIREARKNP